MSEALRTERRTSRRRGVRRACSCEFLMGKVGIVVAILVAAAVLAGCADDAPPPALQDAEVFGRITAIEDELTRIAELLEAEHAQRNVQAAAADPYEFSACSTEISAPALGLLGLLFALDVQLGVAAELLAPAEIASLSSGDMDPGNRHQLQIAQLKWQQRTVERALALMPADQRQRLTLRFAALRAKIEAVQDKMRAASELDWERFRRIDASPESAADDIAAAIDLLWGQCDEYSGRLAAGHERMLVYWRLYWLTNELESAVGASCLAVDCLHGPRRLDKPSREQVRRLKSEMEVLLSSVIRIDSEHVRATGDAVANPHQSAVELMRHHVREWHDGLIVDVPVADWPAQDVWIVFTSISLYRHSLVQGGERVYCAACRSTQ